MKAIEQLQRLERIDYQIYNQCTGTPDDFARSLGVSRRQLYVELDYMKTLGLEIEYSRICETFRYGNNKKLKIFCSVQIVSDSMARNIMGGYSFNNYFVMRNYMH